MFYFLKLSLGSTKLITGPHIGNIAFVIHCLKSVFQGLVYRAVVLAEFF